MVQKTFGVRKQSVIRLELLQMKNIFMNLESLQQ